MYLADCEGIGFDGVNNPGTSGNIPSAQTPNDTDNLYLPSAGIHAPPTTPQDTNRPIPQQPVQPPQQPPQQPLQPAVPAASTSWTPAPTPGE